ISKSNCLLNEGWGLVLNSIKCSVFKNDWLPISTRLKSNNCFFIKSDEQNNSSGEPCLISLEIFIKLSSALANKPSNLPLKKSRFLIKTTVLLEIYFKKLSLLSSSNLFSTLGIIPIFFFFSTDNWVSKSNVRILLTSSPKNSMRWDSSCENENTSTIPQRTKNSHSSDTKSTRLKLYSNNTSFTKSRKSESPTCTLSVFFSNSFRVTTFSKMASGYVTISAGFFLELILFKTSARSKTLALSVSSIWYGRL